MMDLERQRYSLAPARDSGEKRRAQGHAGLGDFAIEQGKSREAVGIFARR